MTAILLSCSPATASIARLGVWRLFGGRLLSAAPVTLAVLSVSTTSSWGSVIGPVG